MLTIDEMIKKFDLKIVVKNGVEGFMVRGATDKEKRFIKENKPAILKEVKRRDEEEKIRIAAAKAAEKKELETYESSLSDDTVLEIEDHSHLGLHVVIGNDSFKHKFKHTNIGKKLLNVITKAKNMKRDAEKFVVSRDYDDYNVWTNYKMTLGQFKEVASKADKILEAKEAKRKKDKEKAEKYFQEKAEEARKTGKKVKLSSWTEPCNDPEEECNWDHMVKYVTPKGEIVTERFHTY